MLNSLLISLLFPVAALGFAAWLIYWIVKKDQGTVTSLYNPLSANN